MNIKFNMIWSYENDYQKNKIKKKKSRLEFRFIINNTKLVALWHIHSYNYNYGIISGRKKSEVDILQKLKWVVCALVKSVWVQCPLLVSACT